MDDSLLVTVGAVYGALQAVAQAVMLIAPKHTGAFRLAKWLVSGLARPAA